MKNELYPTIMRGDVGDINIGFSKIESGIVCCNTTQRTRTREACFGSRDMND